MPYVVRDGREFLAKESMQDQYHPDLTTQSVTVKDLTNLKLCGVSEVKNNQMLWLYRFNCLQ